MSHLFLNYRFHIAVLISNSRTLGLVQTSADFSQIRLLWTSHICRRYINLSDYLLFMSKSDIKKFIQESLKQIENAPPKGFRIDDKIQFDISVITTEKVKGGLDIKIASLDSDIASQNIHKIKFSVIDVKAQKKGWIVAKKILTELSLKMSQIDQEQNPKHITDETKK